MSEVWRPRGPTQRRLAAARQSVGLPARWLARFSAMERQPQAGGPLRPVRYRVPAPNAGLPHRLGTAYPADFAHLTGTVGRVGRPDRRYRVIRDEPWVIAICQPPTILRHGRSPKRASFKVLAVSERIRHRAKVTSPASCRLATGYPQAHHGLVAPVVLPWGSTPMGAGMWFVNGKVAKSFFFWVG